MAESKNRNFGNGIGFWVALGVVFGVVYCRKNGNVSQGIAFGLIIGVVLGVIFDLVIRKK